MSATPIQNKSNQLMTVKNLTDTSADLYIYGEIVDNTDFKWDEADVMPDDVLNALNQVEGLNELNIYINSPGGSVFAGQAIYNMLKRNKAKKTVYVDGVAASMASIIAMVGDTIRIPSNAYLMIHKPLTIAIGNASVFRKLADDLDTIESGLVNIYEENLKDGVDIETIKDLMEKETWLTGEEAAQYFNVDVGESKAIAACATDILARYDKTPQKLVAQVSKPNNQPQPNNEDELFQFQNELDLLEL
ncbi:Clp protease ClpP [Virgibacillus sp. M23]|uniref:head maturation protease, ClpP-related n=1 Tax=Virgibacillus sp. M23 TaxID=3079030 RepID=UPI002A90E614|nr:head maturation protease, ClpP-related [Virgibacillus sp. M23]MDY7044043.1 Clp protease ClpP [Virgibacillus sp. M23]